MKKIQITSGGFFLLTLYTVSQKRPKFETVYFETIWVNFDDIWQKYSEDSRIEFACFNFHMFACYHVIVSQTACRK